MSSHREAPEISKDPVADNTDLYAFVSPDRPNTVTIVANFIPLQSPDGGPNFYEFGDDVAYRINIANRGKAEPDLVYEFRFRTIIRNADTFLYNTGPIKSIHDKNWNRPQFYSVTRRRRGEDDAHLLARDLTVPPVNIGIRSTPHYASTFTAAAVHDLGHGRRVFAGQRADAFFVDLGSIFDLGALRPFQNLHLIPSAAAAGVNGLQGFNVHSIALQVPITDLTRHGAKPTGVADPHAVIGVWASAHRRAAKVHDHEGRTSEHGPFRQVSRLGNPLVNEVIIPMAEKDRWNHRAPAGDHEFEKYVLHPELGALLPVLYPGVFPHLAAYSKPRADLDAILMTGIPSGVVPGFQNFTGGVQADLLRLNVAIPPSNKPSPFGLLGGDPAGYPNGRRLTDDVVAISLRAVAGAALGLVDKSFTPDAAAGKLVDGTSNTNPPLLSAFPYLGTPAGGFQSTPGTPHG
jgi:hypothetical protein